MDQRENREPKLFSADETSGDAPHSPKRHNNLPVMSPSSLAPTLGPGSHTLFPHTLDAAPLNSPHDLHRENSFDNTETPLPEISGFRLIRKLGQGGMGTVFLAQDRALDREVAIKIVSPSFGEGSSLHDRMDAEIQVLAGLQHHGVARLYSAGQHDGRSYFVMEYVEGQTLERFASEPLDPAVAARLLTRLSSAVAYCHERGILHRDLKPSNILLNQADEPKIVDFGLAKVIDTDVSNTRTGEILGTPGYLAPEQASGVVRGLTPACDVYGLGAVLYRLLTGRPPFSAPDPLATVMMVLTDEPLRPRRLVPQLPADLETICLKCLEKRPQRRYASAAALRDDLQRFLENRPITARPVGPLERSIKWMRRHPAASVAISSTALLMIAIVIGLTWHNSTLSNELSRTKRLADQGSELSEWLIRNHMDELATISGTTQIRSDAIEKVKQYLDTSFADMPPDAKYTRRLGESYARLAAVEGGAEFNNLGDVTQAKADYLRALELYDRASAQSGDDSKDVSTIHLLRAKTYLALREIAMELEQTDESRRYHELARESIERAADDGRESRLLKVRMAGADAEVAISIGDFEQAVRMLQLMEESFPEVIQDRDQIDWEHQRIMIELLKGKIGSALDQQAAAEAAIARAVELSKVAMQRDPNHALAALRHCQILVQLGDVQASAGNAEALSTFRSAFVLVADLAARDPLSVALATEVALVHSRISSTLRSLNEVDEAHAEIKKAIAIHERLEQEGKSTLSMARNHAICVLAEADLFVAQQRPDLAEPIFQKHEAICLDILARHPDSLIELTLLGENHFYRAVMEINRMAVDLEMKEGREGELYRRIDQHLTESLEFYDRIETLGGLDAPRQRFRAAVIQVRETFEQAVDQLLEITEKEKAAAEANRSEL